MLRVTSRGVLISVVFAYLAVQAIHYVLVVSKSCARNTNRMIWAVCCVRFPASPHSKSSPSSKSHIRPLLFDLLTSLPTQPAAGILIMRGPGGGGEGSLCTSGHSPESNTNSDVEWYQKKLRGRYRCLLFTPSKSMPDDKPTCLEHLQSR